MEPTLLLRHASVVVTMDADRREIVDGAILVRGNRIAAVGPSTALPQDADEVIDLPGHVLMPGMINTHHHMFQSLTRAVPAAQDCELFDWLRTLYPIWSRITPEMIRVSTHTAMAELMLSGCTTSSDHLYLYPNGSRLDDAIEAATEIGMRFHACRGSMSVGESSGGLPPDKLVEKEEDILRESRRLIETYHDAKPGAMLRVALAPCSPFSVSQALMRESAQMARAYGVGLHTHLAETPGDVAYSMAHFGRTPAQYAEDLGWLGHGVWHAHCVCLDDYGIRLFARSHTGVAHCPSSNMRLGSGIAPIKQMRAAGVPVGLGVDGSASSDAGHILAEARQALLLARVGGDPAGLRARDALEMATLGGAAALDRDDIGSIEVNKCADLVAFDLRGIDHAGAWHDPVAALTLCAPAKAALSVINGRVVVREGQLLSLDVVPLAARHNALAKSLVNGE